MHPDQGTWGIRDELVNRDFMRTPGIVVGPDESTAFDKWWKERLRHGLILPTRKPGEDMLLPRARCLDARSIDFQAAKSWVKDCETHHGDICGGEQQDIEGLRVIDCRTKTVVPAPSKCEYAALSYFRGETGATISHDLLTWDAVSSLFRDTITAAIRLGYDFVWIDRYCAPQVQVGEEERATRHIDEVYTQAHLVMVGACSDDTSIGLPGMETNARQQSASATIGNSTIVATRLISPDSANGSKWYQEGFGFEECLSADRRLIFTDHGLMYQCQGSSSWECSATETFDISLGCSQLRAFKTSSTVFPAIRSVDKYPKIAWELLERLTRKSQGSPLERKIAFSGILHKLSSLSEEFDHVAGLPVYQRPVEMPVASGMVVIVPPKIRQRQAERLASSLVWEAYDSADRQTGYPSWSWTGSTGVIECEDYNIRNLDLEMSFELEKGGRLPIDEYFLQRAESRPHLGKGLHITGPTTFIKLEAPIVNNGRYISVTSFERNDSLEFRHGLRAMEQWDEDMKPGRYLALILGASQATRTSWLTYHLLLLKERDGYYERGFPLEVKDADLNNRVPEGTWAKWMVESKEVLGLERVPWPYAEFPADFGFEQGAREDWEKVFLIAKHLRVETRKIFLR
jgi:hypothetical protein